MNTIRFAGVLFIVLIILVMMVGIPKKPPTEFVTTNGQDFYLENKQFRSVGVNRYNLLTHNKRGGERIGCANPFSEHELDSIFSNLESMGVTTVRFWIFQNFTQGGTDLDRLDYVISTAEKHNIKLIPVLENHWQDCTDAKVKTTDWYASEYQRPYGMYALSLKDYIGRIIPRYKDNPTIFAWEIINETRDVDEHVLYNFASDVSQHIKSIDKNHLVSIGMMGSHTSSVSYDRVYEISTIDFIDFHDYDQEQNPLPNQLVDKITVAKRLNKPLIVGESGIRSTVGNRDSLLDAKMNAFFNEGGDVYLIWSYGDSYITNDGFNFVPNDSVSWILKEKSTQINL